MRKGKNPLLSGPFKVWTIAFTVIPLILIFYYGLTAQEDGRFTLSNILKIATPEYRKALLLSLLLSLISTIICLVMAYPLAMILAGMKLHSTGLIVMIFIIPMWMNFLLRTMAWQTLLEKSGVINMILNALHLPSLNIINTPYAIVLGMVYNFLPFMLLPIYNSLVKIDPAVINAARDLGALLSADLFLHHGSPYHSGHYQRHYHGVRSGTDHLCHLRSSWRKQNPPHRKCH